MNSRSLVAASALFVSSLPAGLLGGLLAGCGNPDGRTCQTSSDPQPAAGFCAPARVASGMPLRLQIREQCGGCTQQATRCEVVVNANQIKLRLLGQTCTLDPGTACPAICSVTAFDCAVPALTAGTYRVSAEANVPMEMMMVAESTTTTTSCTTTTP